MPESESRSRKRKDKDRRDRDRDSTPPKSRDKDGKPKAKDVKPKAPAADERFSTKTGGAYIPPAKLRMMQKEIQDKSSAEYQRLAWETLKKSINGLINKVNTSNLTTIVRELIKQNLIRGRGLLCRSIMQAQAASQTFTNVYAALVAIINSKFPNIGELLLKRLVIQFRRGYKRNNKPICLSAAKFIGHLVNQQVAHEVLALEILTLLLEHPTEDSVEVAIAFLKEVGARLEEVSPRGAHAIFERLRHVLHEGHLEKRVQYMIEVMFQVRKDKFKDFPTLPNELDLVEEEDQFTHLLTLDEVTEGQDILNVFKVDEEYTENEDKYATLRKEILDDSEEEGSGGEDEEDDEEEDEDAEGKETILDKTETNLLALRRTIYLTIQSSLDFEECCHKILRLNLKEGQESELCHMILDCCAQQRTYEKFFGLLAQRFCNLGMGRKYIEPFQQIFKDTYDTVHRLDTNKLRNVAKFFSHLLYTDAIAWSVLEHIKLTEDETTSSSRIFIKILMQELSEFMGLQKLNQRLQDTTLVQYFEGLFPRDHPKNTRFSINFFTSIGLGGLTDELREFLKKQPKPTAVIAPQQTSIEGETAVGSASSSGSSSSSSDSSDSSSSSGSDSSSSDSSSDSDSSSGSSSDSSSDSSSSSDSDSRRKKKKKSAVVSKKKKDDKLSKRKDTTKGKPSKTKKMSRSLSKNRDDTSGRPPKIREPAGRGSFEEGLNSRDRARGEPSKARGDTSPSRQRGSIGERLLRLTGSSPYQHAEVTQGQGQPSNSMNRSRSNERMLTDRNPSKAKTGSRPQRRDSSEEGPSKVRSRSRSRDRMLAERKTSKRRGSSEERPSKIRERSPSPRSKRRDISEERPSRIRDRSPSPRSKRRDIPEERPSRIRDRSPSPRSKRRDISEERPSRIRDRSPSPRTKRRDISEERERPKSPSRSKRRDISEERPSKAARGRSRSRDKMLTESKPSKHRDISEERPSRIRDRSPSARSKRRDNSEERPSKTRNMSPSPRSKRNEISEERPSKIRDRSPSPRSKRKDVSEERPSKNRDRSRRKHRDSSEERPSKTGDRSRPKHRDSSDEKPPKPKDRTPTGSKRRDISEERPSKIRDKPASPRSKRKDISEERPSTKHRDSSEEKLSKLMDMSPTPTRSKRRDGSEERPKSRERSRRKHKDSSEEMPSKRKDGSRKKSKNKDRSRSRTRKRAHSVSGRSRSPSPSPIGYWDYVSSKRRRSDSPIRRD